MPRPNSFLAQLNLGEVRPPSYGGCRGQCLCLDEVVATFEMMAAKVFEPILQPEEEVLIDRVAVVTRILGWYFD